MDRKEMQNTRLYFLLIFLFAMLFIYLGVLYDTQVIHYEDYAARAVRSIVRSEKVEASRGIMTDRNGRVLVSNRSTYDLTFDASLLSPGSDANEAVLRLLDLCQSRGVDWNDSLPVSRQAPYIYTIDTASNSQKDRFLTYLKSVSSTRDALGAYLLRNPDLIPPEEDGEDETGAGASAKSGGTAEPATLTPLERGRKLLDRFPASSLTASLLHDAGITPATLLGAMRKDLNIPGDYSQSQARLVIGVQYELALRKLNDAYEAFVLAHDIDTVFISILSDGSYQGAKITRSFVREYATEYAAHILGSLGSFESRDEYLSMRDQGYDFDDLIGRSGAERAFEKYLKGTDGYRRLSFNSDGKVTGEYYSIEPEPGGIVELTIDLEFQQAVEDILAGAVARVNETDYDETRGAGAAVVKVGTGEILALASYPTYSLSTYRQDIAELNQDPGRPVFNRASSGTYPPGSTLKPFTAIAALEHGDTTLTERIRDTGKWRYPGDEQNSWTWCWYHPGHGYQNVVQAITNSCNYFFAEMGYRMGMDTLRDYLVQFGLGVPTGIEIGENPGKLPENPEGQNQAPWAAFGQSSQLYSPLQLANYVATLVSGGRHCQAHLLKAAKSYDKSEVIAVGNTEPVHTVDIKEENLQAVKQGMHGLVTTGSLASYFRSCVVDAGAKTGTAQVYSNVNTHSVFVCFAPYDEPEIAVAIAIERGGSGSVLASTGVNILNAYFTPKAGESTVTGENQLLR